ncbi:MAG: hypothetical protein LH606_07440, partial [Cytophagaceae bacterium]|nr:hypothetical protein [Cytophagaceae bacterium]
DEAGTPALPFEQPVQTNAIWVNLREYGFTKAGEHHGDALALSNLFNQIQQGFILDENVNDEKQRVERERIEEEITATERTGNELRTEVRRLKETEIPKVEGAISLVDDDINQVELNALKRIKDPSHLDRFNLRLYWWVFIPATVFVYLFYVSAFHSAFFRDIISEAEQAANNGANIQMNPYFNRQAFAIVDLHWLVPFIFFLFGLILHIVYDSSGRSRWPKLVAVLLFILVADGLLAYNLESTYQQLKIFMGIATPDYHFYTSTVFYMVLILGFFTCLGWSILLHEIRNERQKLNVEKVTQVEIRTMKEKRLKLTNQIQDLNATMVQHDGKIEMLSLDIRRLIQKRDKISLCLVDLEKRLTDFYDGWLNYINLLGRDKAALKVACQAVLTEFHHNHLPSLTLQEAA